NLGNLFQTIGNYEKVIYAYGKAAEILEKINPQDRTLVDSYLAIANAYFSKSEFENAIKYYNTALTTLLKFKRDDSTTITAIIYCNIANTFVKMNDNEKAVENYQKAISIFETDPEGFNIYITSPLTSLIELCTKIKKDDMAREYSARLDKAVFENIKELIGNLDLMKEAGNFYLNAGEKDKCKSMLKDAIDKARSEYGEEKKEFYSFLHQIASIYKNFKFYEEAMAVFDVIIEKAPHISDPPLELVAFAFNDKGLYHSSKNEFELAMEYFEKSFETYCVADKGESYRSTMILSNMADMYHQMNRLDECLITYEGLLDKLQKFDREDKTGTLNGLAGYIKALFRSGNKEGAFQKLETYRAVLVSAHGEASRKHSEYYSWAGNLALEFDHVDEAKTFFDKALSMTLKFFSNDKILIGVNYKDIGTIYYLKGE
ncbi:MAG TPA: tetratricopeptide repeat protein, partial [Candidatus Wallbacteria bacterium]|nr:tetratricopeptide repeat protein [Candidatus Wallbacteria bacterium]